MGVSNFVSIVCLLFSDVITDRDTTHDKMKIVEHSGKTLPCLARSLALACDLLACMSATGSSTILDLF